MALFHYLTNMRFPQTLTFHLVHEIVYCWTLKLPVYDVITEQLSSGFDENEILREKLFAIPALSLLFFNTYITETDSVLIIHISLCISGRAMHTLLIKAQTSLAPLSRFRGSRITTAHAHHCCRFQLCEDCAIMNEIDYEIDDA